MRAVKRTVPTASVTFVTVIVQSEQPLIEKASVNAMEIFSTADGSREPVGENATRGNPEIVKDKAIEDKNDFVVAVAVGTITVAVADAVALALAVAVEMTGCASSNVPA